ncbi:hypothetical protein HDU98_008375 [Podochytrium sp. JEL0797]|nr:hypothetical protein HDU98_008375 [Podochytrium sp. JEL0797]
MKQVPPPRKQRRPTPATSPLKIPRRWLRILLVLLVAALLAMFSYLIHVIASLPALPNTSRQRQPMHPVINLGREPAKNITPIPLVFSTADSYQESAVERWSLPSDPDAAKAMREGFFESNSQRDSFGDWIRISKRDTGNFTTLPKHHFSTNQTIQGNATEYIEMALMDVKYFHECEADTKFDVRFAAHVDCVKKNKTSRARIEHDVEMVHESLVAILRAWSLFGEREGVWWWISHGEMIGWWWNGELLPWDTDLDIQVSIAGLIGLIKWNGTVLEDRFLIDVNPAFAVRTPQSKNTIDARVVDMQTGLFMDITALTQLHDPDKVYCKSPHPYHYDQLMPLHETVLEGITVWRPRAVVSILREEYSRRALERERFVSYSSHGVYRFSHWTNKWVKEGPRKSGADYGTTNRFFEGTHHMCMANGVPLVIGVVKQFPWLNQGVGKKRTNIGRSPTHSPRSTTAAMPASRYAALEFKTPSIIGTSIF